MLCQRCATLVRATRPAAAPMNAAKRALSTSQPPRGRRPAQTLSLATAAQALPRQQQQQQLNPVLPRYTTRSLHVSPARATPAASAESAEAPARAAGTIEKPDFLNEAESEVWDRLAKEFSPVELVVQDISGGCGSMYGIEISSERFRGANMLKQQRMVNAVLGDLMKGWHGCQLKTRVP